MLNAILGLIGSKVGLVGSGFAAGAAALWAGNKYLPKYLGNLAAGGIKSGLASIDKITDPVEKVLVHNIAVDVVKWAEYKIPDRGQGHARYDLAAAKLCAMLPFLKGKDDAVSDIIENAVVAMDTELKRVQ